MFFFKISDYADHRVVITPTGFDMLNSQHGPAERMWAKVIVLGPPQDLGIVQVFNHTLINQVKQLYVGRPLVGTLVRREGPGGSTILVLEDIKESKHA